MSFRKLPPLNALTAFEAVARHRSLTKAAKELFLTHSAVSQRVTQLERHLDAQLLIRSSRSVELTPTGARYLDSVQQALSTLAEASGQVERKELRLIRLSVVPVLASNWLISRLRSFHRLHRDIDLEIQSSKAMANVKGGEADVAVRWGNGDWPGLEKVRLFSDELFPVCSKSYLVEIGALRVPGDLRLAVLLRHSLQPWKPWFESAGLKWPEPNHGPMFNDRSLMLQAAIDGQGVALGQRMLIEDLIEEGALVRLFDVSVLVESAFYVVFLKQSLQRAEIAAFVEWITSMAAADATARATPDSG